jgi:predicted O-methyltransferase YrrM
MIIFRVTRYLKYKLLSKHYKGHGIHSPFIFDLVSRVFRNKTDPDIVCTIEKVRKKMKSDHRSIIVKDFGSGSASMKTNKRKVSEIARYSPVSRKYGALLSALAAEFGDRSIVEFGTSLGISTMYLASGCKNAAVKTMEGCPEISEIARANFKEAGIKNVEVITGSFEELLPDLIRKNIKPGLVFIDGNHRKEPVVNYFTQISEISDSKTVIIIDDINYSKEMEEAWNVIKRFERVSVTVDLNRMGIVFFREGISHNNYTIRY